MLRKILIYIGVFITFNSQILAQETCVTSSRIPYEWPSQRNWLITTNLFSGKILNTLTGGTTTSGDAFKPVQAYEGVTAVSDDSGNLLFFSAGRTIQGPDGAELYNGLLTGNEGGSTAKKGSASQGVMAIRHPLNPDHYYFVTTDDALTGTSNGLNYAVIDKDGNMVQGSTRLGNFRTTEGIAATWHENNVDIWVTVTEAGSTNIHSYLLKCDGFVSTGVTSAVGKATGYSDAERGGVAFSWDSQYYVAGFGSTAGAERVRLYDFDNATGQLTLNSNIGADVASAGGYVYDITFSPDNSRVLASTNTGQIFSINISNGSGTSVMGSSGSHSAIEIGADGSLYRATLGQPTQKLTGNLNSGSSLSGSYIAGTSGSRGLTTMFLPPPEEPDIEEVGPYCNTDDPVDLNTTWICSGLDAEDPTENPTAYTGPGITDQANGIFDPSVAGEGTHTIIFTYCSVNDTIEIVVAPCCTAELDDQTPEICVGETVTLDAFVTDASGTGVWTIDSMPAGTSPIITTGADTIFDASNLAVTAGTYKLKFTVTDEGASCYDSLYIIVNPLPIVDLGDDQEICADGSTVTFDAGTHTSYLWNDGSTDQTLETSTAGEYWVKVTNVNGCSDTDTVNLTVNALPVVDLGPDQEICDGESVTFDAGSFDSYLWNDASTNQTLDATDAGDYWVKITDANGCTDSDSVVLVVNALPVVDLGPDQEICDGESVTFDAGSFDSYLWNDASSNQTLDATDAGDYWVKIIDANGCTDSDSVVLVVNALPVVDLGPDQEFCEGGSVTFDAGSFDSYLWNDASTNQTLDATTSGDYVVKVTDVNGCTDSDSVVLVVNALPVVDLGPDVEICAGGLGIMFDAGDFDAYAWLPTGEVTQTINTNTAGEYIVEVTDSKGCVDTDSVVLVVNENPIVDLGNDITICPGSAVTLDAGPNFANYVWSDASMNQTLEVTDANAGVFNVLAIDTNNCSARDTIEVIVAAELSVDLGPDTAFCEGNSITLDAGNIAGATYEWKPNLEDTQTIEVSTTGEYSVLVVDPMGCQGKDTIVVTVNPNPVVDLGPDVTVCPDIDSLFTVGAVWSEITWNDGSSNESIVLNSEGTYYVDVVDANGCTATDTAEFAFFAGASVDLGKDLTICPGTFANFDAGSFASYTWHDGSSLQTYAGTTAEKIWVDVVDANGCEAVDTAEIFMASSLPVDLGPDTALCEGE